MGELADLCLVALLPCVLSTLVQIFLVTAIDRVKTGCADQYCKYRYYDFHGCLLNFDVNDASTQENIQAQKRVRGSHVIGFDSLLPHKAAHKFRTLWQRNGWADRGGRDRNQDGPL